MTSLRLRTALTATVLALTAAGCGGGGGDGDDRASGGDAPSASPSPSPVTSASGVAAAAKINLTAADLPGYKATPADETSDTESEALEDELAKCVGASTADAVAEFSSDDFAKGEQLPSVQVSSQVAFVRDTAQVQQDVQAFTGDKAGPCISTFVQKAIESGAGELGLTFSKPKVTELTPNGEGTDGAFGFRVATSATAAGQTIPFTLDLLGFGEKQTEVTLLLLGVGTSVPDAQRDELFAKLVARGTANAL